MRDPVSEQATEQSRKLRWLSLTSTQQAHTTPYKQNGVVLSLVCVCTYKCVQVEARGQHQGLPLWAPLYLCCCFFFFIKTIILGSLDVCMYVLTHTWKGEDKLGCLLCSGFQAWHHPPLATGPSHQPSTLSFETGSH